MTKRLSRFKKEWYPEGDRGVRCAGMSPETAGGRGKKPYGFQSRS